MRRVCLLAVLVLVMAAMAPQAAWAAGEGALELGMDMGIVYSKLDDPVCAGYYDDYYYSCYGETLEDYWIVQVPIPAARIGYFLSDRVSADECLRLGIANQVVPAAELEESTLALAHRLASGPPTAYRYMKENINRAAMGADVLECLDLEATHHVHTGLTEDHREAARAFVEKREPVFKGK